MFAYDDKEMRNDEAHIREVTDNMRYSLQRLKTVRNLTDGVEGFEAKLPYYFDILKYHSNWGMFFLKDELQKVAYSKADLHKGFEHPEQIMGHGKKKGAYILPEERLAIPKEQEEILRDLLFYLKENNQKAKLNP